MKAFYYVFYVLIIHYVIKSELNSVCSTNWHQIEAKRGVDFRQLLIFFSIECSEVDVIFVSYVRNSRDQTSLRLRPATHMCYSHMKEKLCSKEIFSKHSWM